MSRAAGTPGALGAALQLARGRGVVSVVSNVVPGHMARLCEAASAGDLVRARELHFAVEPLCDLLFAEPNPIPVKAALELLGQMSAEVREPLAPCSPALRARLADHLRQKGLL